MKKVININRSMSCSCCDGVKREMPVSPKTVNSVRSIPFIGEMEEIKKTVKRMREKEAEAAVQENRKPRVIRDFHPHTLRKSF